MLCFLHSKNQSERGLPTNGRGLPKVCPGFAQGFAQGVAHDLELNFRCFFGKKTKDSYRHSLGNSITKPIKKVRRGRGRGREGLCDTWLAVEIAEKSIAANVTGKRRGEKYREREHKKEVVRIGKANMARNGGGGC